MGDFSTTPVYDTVQSSVISTETMIGHLATITAVSTAWPSTNLAIFVPFRLVQPRTVYKMIVGEGPTATGNFDVGIYDAQGNRLVSSGTTAKGASTEHVLDVTDTQIGPGLFYLAMSADGTINFMMTTPTGASVIQKTRMMGVVQMATAFVLPATATFAALSTSASIPMMAAVCRAY